MAAVQAGSLYTKDGQLYDLRWSEQVWNGGTRGGKKWPRRLEMARKRWIVWRNDIWGLWWWRSMIKINPSRIRWHHEDVTCVLWRMRIETAVMHYAGNLSSKHVSVWNLLAQPDFNEQLRIKKKVFAKLRHKLINYTSLNDENYRIFIFEYWRAPRRWLGKMGHIQPHCRHGI